jgi:hypothetical protein
MPSVVTENVVRCLDQPQCAALVLLSLQTGQEPRITTLRAVVVYRARGKKLVVVIGQKKALHAQDTEAALIVVEGDALDQPGYFIGRGLAFRKCGVRGSESFLPWEAARGRAHQEADSTRIWLRGEVCVGSGVSEVNEGFGAKLKTDCGTATNRG